MFSFRVGVLSCCSGWSQYIRVRVITNLFSRKVCITILCFVRSVTVQFSVSAP